MDSLLPQLTIHLDGTYYLGYQGVVFINGEPVAFTVANWVGNLKAGDVVSNATFCQYLGDSPGVDQDPTESHSD